VATVVEEYFDTLARQGFQPTLRHVRGTVRCDLVRGGQTDHWLVRIDFGNLSVSHEYTPADCIIRTDVETFGRIVTGAVNPLVALMRGMAAVDGDEELILALQRMLPGPPDQPCPPSAASAARSGRSG
jgi:SCP-2 sterol transfer family protein